MPNPREVLNRLANALEPGARLVVLDYFNYLGVSVQPYDDDCRDIFLTYDKSVRTLGGSFDVGGEIPNWLAELGFVIEHLVPIQKIGRPGSSVWQWVSSFHASQWPVTIPMSAQRLRVLLRSQTAIWDRQRNMAKRDMQLERARYEVDLLISVGRTLSQERDIDSLLDRILHRAHCWRFGDLAKCAGGGNGPMAIEARYYIERADAAKCDENAGISHQRASIHRFSLRPQPPTARRRPRTPGTRRCRASGPRRWRCRGRGDRRLYRY